MFSLNSLAALLLEIDHVFTHPSHYQLPQLGLREVVLSRTLLLVPISEYVCCSCLTRAVRAIERVFIISTDNQVIVDDVGAVYKMLLCYVS